jgi:hypothetical protein
MRPEITLTHAGVLMDVLGIGFDEYTPEQRNQVIAALPRGDFKNEFIQVQTRSALKKPQTTFGTVNVEFIECSDPTFRKPNVCTRIHNAPCPKDRMTRHGQDHDTANRLRPAGPTCYDRRRQLGGSPPRDSRRKQHVIA